ncbi:MAG: hypothetical protein KJ737_05615 [Proteobacteria bacterium]|nr:hypothetical protein [Pseudomonadota bacterium]
MKTFFAIFLSLTFLITASAPAAEPSEKNTIWDQMGIRINGELKVQAKYQDSYKTPLDHPQWANHAKSGANHRNDQNIRSKGYFNFSFGDIGQSEWFGIIETYFDANKPDTDTGEESEAVFEPFFFSCIMYRPFEMAGGRPFGATMGIQAVPATINGYYSHVFAGDFDLDFAANLSSGLISMPAITFDFHISQDTGVGVTWAKGCSYASEACAFVHPDSATTLALWLEGRKYGFGLNAAMQWVGGNRGSTSTKETNNGNTYNEYSDKVYRHQIFNTLLSYTFNLSGMEVKPFLGYQAMWGDETPLPQYADEEATIQDFEYAGYKSREFEGNLKTAGFTLTKTLFGKKNELAVEFTKVDIPGLDGIGGLKKGTIDQYIQVAMAENKDEINALAAEALGIPADMDVDVTAFWSKSPLAGFNKSIYNFADIDFVVSLEHTIALTDRIKLGAFAYSLKAKDDRTINNLPYIKTQMENQITKKIVREMRLSEENAAEISGMLVDELETRTLTDETGQEVTYLQYIANDTKPAEWTDTWSVGMFISYNF